MDKIKYLLDGQEVIVKEKVTCGYLVNYIYTTDNDDEDFIGKEVYFVDEVFETTPTLKTDLRIKRLENEIKLLNKEKKNIQDEIKHIKTTEKDTLNKYSSEQLKQLFDFLDDKITHFVVLSYMPTIETFENFMKAEYGRNRLKLITLYGEADKNLTWRINQYADDSGIEHEIIPCLSEAEAMEKLQEYILNTSKTNMSAELKKAADKYNLKVDVDAEKEWRQQQIERYEKQIKDYLQQIEQYQMKIKEILHVS